MDVYAAQKLGAVDLCPTASAAWVVVVPSFPRPLDERLVAEFANVGVQTSGNGFELKAASDVCTVSLFEFDESRDDKIDIILIPFVHLRDLPVAEKRGAIESIGQHGRIVDANRLRGAAIGSPWDSRAGMAVGEARSPKSMSRKVKA